MLIFNTYYKYSTTFSVGNCLICSPVHLIVSIYFKVAHKLPVTNIRDCTLSIKKLEQNNGGIGC